MWFCVGGVLMAPPAQAASGGCPGRLVSSLPFSTGEVRVYKSRTQACAMTVANHPGERRAMSVSIQPRGGVPVGDSGRFTRYAGPVTVGAINRCVYVKGSVGGPVRSLPAGFCADQRLNRRSAGPGRGRTWPERQLLTAQLGLVIHVLIPLGSRAPQ
ncbi:hypothetical protein GCM10020254_54120 [Streptomyces goshikiensis]